MQLYHQMLSEVWKYELKIWNSENIITYGYLENTEVQKYGIVCYEMT